MLTTKLYTNPALNCHLQGAFDTQKSTSPAANIACCALSAAKAPSEARELNSHSFPVSNWVFEVEGHKFTLMMKDGQLVGKPFQVEHQEKEYYGFIASSLSQAIESVMRGERDFSLVANENNLNYTHSIVFMHEGEVKARPVNFTQYGEKNTGESIFPNLNEFYRHSVAYANKYAVPVSAAV